VYEWFLNSHTSLAIVAVAAWVHTPSGGASKLFLRIGSGLWASAAAVHWLLVLFRNVVPRRPFARAIATQAGITEDSNALRFDITVPRPWQVRAGQSIFLSIPKLGVFTGLRGHPFMISWWDRDQRGGGLVLSLLVEPRAGFTAELSRLVHNKLNKEGLGEVAHAEEGLLAFIDGPYGAPHGFGQYGTVVMIASGIGIAGHMPYIKDLITGNLNCEVRTQRVVLVWQTEGESEYRRSPAVQNADQLKARKHG
jgi:predicted ferric reductase